MSQHRKDKVWQTTETVQRYLTHTRNTIPMSIEQIELTLNILSRGEVPITNFLDLGCGDGVLAGAVLATYPDAQATLLDFSEPMLAAARQSLSQTYSDVTFVLADYADPMWVKTVTGQTPFDAIVSRFSIHHQPDSRKQSLYAEIFELLTPGGFFINIEHVSSPSPWLQWMWEEQVIDSMFAARQNEEPNLTREQVAKQFRSRTDREANILAPVEDQCDWLRAIGFADVDCYFKIFELAVFGGRRPELSP